LASIVIAVLQGGSVLAC